MTTGPARTQSAGRRCLFERVDRSCSGRTKLDVPCNRRVHLFRRHQQDHSARHCSGLSSLDRDRGRRRAVRQIEDDEKVVLAERKIYGFDLAADALDSFIDRCAAARSPFLRKPFGWARENAWQAGPASP